MIFYMKNDFFFIYPTILGIKCVHKRPKKYDKHPSYVISSTKYKHRSIRG